MQNLSGGGGRGKKDERSLLIGVGKIHSPPVGGRRSTKPTFRDRECTK